MDLTSHNHDASPSLEPSISPPHVNPPSRKSLLDRLSIPHPPVEPSKDGGAPFRPSSPMPPMSFDTFQFSSLTTKGVPSLLQRMFHSGHPSLHSPADLREKQTAPPLNNSTLQEIPVVSVLNGNSKVSQSIDTEGAPPFPSGSEDMIVELSSQVSSMKAPEISQSSSTAYLPPLEASSPSQPNSLSVESLSISPLTAAKIHLTQQDIRTTLAPAPLLSPFSLVSSGMLPPTPMSAPSYTHEHAFVQNFFPPSLTPFVGSASLTTDESVNPLISPPAPALPQARPLSYLDVLYAEVQQEQNEWSQLAERKRQKAATVGAVDRQDSAVLGSGASIMASPSRGPSLNGVELSTTIAGSASSSNPKIAPVVQSTHAGVDCLGHDHFEAGLPSKINATSSVTSIPPSNHSLPLATSQLSHESWRDKSARSLLRHPAVPQWIRELESTDSKHLAHDPVQMGEDRSTILPTSTPSGPISLKRGHASAFDNDGVVKTEGMDEVDALRSPSKRAKWERSSRSPVIDSPLSTDDAPHSDALPQPSRTFPTPPNYSRHQIPPSPEDQPHTDTQIPDADPGSYPPPLRTLQQARSSVVRISSREAKTEASSLVDYEAPSYSNQPSVRGPHNAQYRTASISESLEAPVLNHGDCLDVVPAYSRPRHKDPSEEQGRGLPEQDLGPTPRSPDVHGRPASRVNDNLTGEKPVVPRDDPSHAISSHPPVNSRFDGPTPDIPGTVKPIESPFVQSSTPITRQRYYPTSNNTGIPQASVLPSLVSPKPQLVTTQDLRAEGFPIPKESTTTAPPSSSEADPLAPTCYPEVDSGLGGPDDYGNDSIEALRPDENSESHLDSKVPSTSSVERMQTDTPLQPSPESSGRRANRSLRRPPGESRSQIPSRGQSPDPFQTRYSPRSRRHHDTWPPEPSPPHHRPRPYSPHRDRSIPYAQRRSRSPSPRSRPQHHSLNQHRWKEASSYRSRYRRSLSPVQIGDTSPALDRPSSPVRTEGARLHTRKGQVYVSDPVRGSAWRPPAPPSRSLSPLASPGGRRYELVTRSPTPPDGRPVRRRLPSSALEADRTNNANAEPSKDTVPIPVPPMLPRKPSPSVSPVIRSPAAGQLIRSVALPPRPTTPSLTASMGHKEITNPDSTSSESDVTQPQRVNYSSGSLLSASRKASIPERPPQYPGTSSLSVSSNPPSSRLRRLGTLSDRLAAGDSRSAEEGLFPDRLDTPVSQALTVIEGPKKSLLSRMNPKIEAPLISQDDNHRRNGPGSMVAMDDTSPISSASLFSRVGGSPTRQRVNPLASLYDVQRGNHIPDKNTSNTESSQPAPTGSSDLLHQTSSHRGGPGSRPRGRSRGRGRRFGYEGV